jgi:serine phosphatase RsbU (regulator of sigma subunit)
LERRRPVTKSAAASSTGSVSPSRAAAEPSSVSLPPPAFRRGQVLGVVPDPDLDVQRLSLPAHSLLLLYTDGAREAWDPAGNMFGEYGLRAVLAEAAQQPAQSICEQIFQRLAAHRGLAPQQDDITLVAVKA